MPRSVKSDRLHVCLHRISDLYIAILLAGSSVKNYFITRAFLILYGSFKANYLALLERYSMDIRLEIKNFQLENVGEKTPL